MRIGIPARMRTPLLLAACGVAVGVVDGATQGWAAGPVAILAVFVLVVPAGYYVWGGRETDTGAAIRRELDERQLLRRLKIQALVGKVVTVGAAASYLAAVAVHAVLWPFAGVLALVVLTAAVGWVVYRER